MKIEKINRHSTVGHAVSVTSVRVSDKQRYEQHSTVGHAISVTSVRVSDKQRYEQRRRLGKATYVAGSDVRLIEVAVTPARVYSFHG